MKKGAIFTHFTLSIALTKTEEREKVKEAKENRKRAFFKAHKSIIFVSSICPIKKYKVEKKKNLKRVFVYREWMELETKLKTKRE